MINYLSVTTNITLTMKQMTNEVILKTKNKHYSKFKFFFFLGNFK